MDFSKMSSTARGIGMEFCVQYDNDRKNFGTHLTNAFSAAYNMGGSDCLNEVFLYILSNFHLTLDHFKMAIEKGADPRYQEDMPFVITCKYPKSDIARYLLDNYNIDIHVHNNYAIAYSNTNDEALLRIFLDRGIEIDTGLILSCLDKPAKLKLIIDRGADLNKILNFFITSHINRCEASAKILLDAIILNNTLICFDTNNLNKFLENRISIFNLESIKEFIKLGANPRFNNDSIFVRSCGVQKQVSEIPLYFLNNCECDVNAQNSNALQNSIVCWNIDISKILLDFGANVSNTHISAAISAGFDYVSLLLDYGAPLESIGQAYLDSMWDFDVAKLFISRGGSLDALIQKTNLNRSVKMGKIDFVN